jgi:hypothetical protein
MIQPKSWRLATARSDSDRILTIWKAAQCSNWSRLHCAYCSALNKSRAESPPRSAAAVCSSKLPTATPCTKPRKVVLLAVDTNVLVYAADAD